MIKLKINDCGGSFNQLFEKGIRLQQLYNCNVHIANCSGILCIHIPTLVTLHIKNVNSQMDW